MRFLLLCPVALLLLTAPAKAISTDSVEVPTIPTQSQTNDSSTTEATRIEPIDSSPSPATTTPTVSVSSSTELTGKSAGDKPDQPAVDQPDPKVVRQLSRELAEARAELKALREEHKIVADTLWEEQHKKFQLVLQRNGLDLELERMTAKLNGAQDKLNAEGPQDEQCKLSESELAKQIDEETSRQLEERKAEVERSFARKYENTLNEVRLKIRKQMQLLGDRPTIKFKPKN